MWKRFINWYLWHGPQIITGRKIFEKLARCQNDCKNLDDHFNWMAIRPVIFSLEELKKNTWDIDRVAHIQKWLTDNFEEKMTDRFKFRVWSEEDCGYMESNDIFRLTHSGKLVFNNDSLNREPECNPKRYICEQCTGLKDKNGKLIYEGDIVKLSSDREVVCPVVWDNEETGFCVEYKKELYRFNTYKKYHMIEVIGNIHENPELLEVQDV